MAIRGMSETTQVNELLCEVLCHTIVSRFRTLYELGIQLQS